MAIVFTLATFVDNKNGKCLSTGLAVEMRTKDEQVERTYISTTDGYGKLILTKLIAIMRNLERLEFENTLNLIKIITGQPTPASVLTKLFRIYQKALTGKNFTKEHIEKLVFVDGHYTKRANDELYVEILLVMLSQLEKYKIIYEHFNQPNGTTYRLAQLLQQEIAPTKTLKKRRNEGETK